MAHLDSIETTSHYNMETVEMNALFAVITEFLRTIRVASTNSKRMVRAAVLALILGPCIVAIPMVIVKLLWIIPIQH